MASPRTVACLSVLSPVRDRRATGMRQSEGWVRRIGRRRCLPMPWEVSHPDLMGAKVRQAGEGTENVGGDVILWEHDSFEGGKGGKGGMREVSLLVVQEHPPKDADA